MDKRWICRSCREINHLDADTCFHCAAPGRTAGRKDQGETRFLPVAPSLDVTFTLEITFVALAAIVLALALARAWGLA